MINGNSIEIDIFKHSKTLFFPNIGEWGQQNKLISLHQIN